MRVDQGDEFEGECCGDYRGDADAERTELNIVLLAPFLVSLSSSVFGDHRRIEVTMKTRQDRAQARAGQGRAGHRLRLGQ
jgi:hypothetical protein